MIWKKTEHTEVVREVIQVRFLYHYDGLGSVTNVTSAAGTPQWSYSYEPFGTSRMALKLDPLAPDNPMRFTGEYQDPTGLNHLRARQYDPGVGRFTATDPWSAGISNPYVSSYAYVGNQPTVYIDPSGLCRQQGTPSVARYLVGYLCSPEGFRDRFGYEPQEAKTKAGPRMLKPHGECSGPIDETGVFYNWNNACKAHDYGYDPIRFGAIDDRDWVDQIFRNDMMADCADRAITWQDFCEESASWVHWLIRRFGGGVLGEVSK